MMTMNTGTMNRKSASGSGAPSTRHGRVGQVIVAGVAVMFGAFVTQIASTPTAPATTLDCVPPAPAPMLVTADCVDPRFKDPYTDIDEMRNTPAPHRYVHGGFTGT